jgi:hypothetical protein
MLWTSRAHGPARERSASDVSVDFGRQQARTGYSCTLAHCASTLHTVLPEAKSAKTMAT